MVGCTTKDHAEMMKDLLLLTFPTESALNDDGIKWVIRSWWVTYCTLKKWWWSRWAVSIDGFLGIEMSIESVSVYNHIHKSQLS